MSSATVTYADNSASAMRTGMLLGLVLGALGGFAIGVLFVMAVLTPDTVSVVRGEHEVSIAPTAAVAIPVTAIDPEPLPTATAVPPQLVASIIRVSQPVTVATATTPAIPADNVVAAELLLLYQIGAWVFFCATLVLAIVLIGLMRRIMLDEVAFARLDAAFTQAVHLLSRHPE